ncbi:MAG: hypothetical protein U0L19_11550 [Bacteroidales bacterium]|nr:hypothetical protein [Bacteroidales bacterium]
MINQLVRTFIGQQYIIIHLTANTGLDHYLRLQLLDELIVLGQHGTYKIEHSGLTEAILANDNIDVLVKIVPTQGGVTPH